jgi:HEAT repeat protein
MVIEHSNMMFKLGKQAQGAVKDLLAMIQTGNDVSRSIAVVTLSEIGDKSCVKHILPLLDDSTMVRVWALYALGRLKNPEVIKDILPLLKDGDGDIREFAVFALDQIGDPAVVNHLMPLLKDSELTVRMRAIRAINKFGGFSNVKRQAILQEVRPLLKELPNRAGGIAFQDFYDNGTEIIRTIAALNDTFSAKDIVPLLHQFYYVRAEAIMALGKLDKEAAVKHLVPLLVARDEGTLTNGKKTNNEVREVVIKTLTQVGDPSVLKSLLPLLEDPDDEIKLYTAIAVSRFGDIRAIPVWIYLIDKYGVWHLSSYEDRVNYGWLAVTIDEVRGGYEFAREGLEKLAGEAAAKSRLFREKKIDSKDYIGQAKLWKAWWANEGKAWYEQELKKIEKKD